MYATHRQFCRIFQEDMNALYRLSFLLTANPQRAEQCFIAALEDCLDETSSIFADRARAWSSRAIVHKAIQLNLGNLMPLHEAPSTVETAVQFRMEGPLAALMQLHAFERLVFVLTVLEQYSDSECALLLNCRRTRVETARASAFEYLAALNEGREISSGVLEHSATADEMKKPVSLIKVVGG